VKFYYQNPHEILEPVGVRATFYESYTDEEIVVKVPILYHDKIKLLFLGPVSFNLDLKGFIPMEDVIDQVGHIQMLNENVAYITDGKKIYKSEDGFCTYEAVIDLGGKFIGSFYFMDENNAWIGVNEPKIPGGSSRAVHIYFTNNGGETLSQKYQIGEDIGSIHRMEFPSLAKGYVVTSKGKMFVCDQDQVQNIFDYFPELSSVPYSDQEIFSFTAVSEDLVFLAPNSDPYLTKIENGNVSYSTFETWPSAPFLFDQTGYVQVNEHIYKTVDAGNTWEKIKTFQGNYARIHFFDKDVGLAILEGSDVTIFKTTDGGNTWNDYWSPSLSLSQPR